MLYLFVYDLCRYDRSTLKVLGTVGEPINPEAWLWYYNVVGNKQCAIVDTFWQTETVSIQLLSYTPPPYTYILVLTPIAPSPYTHLTPTAPPPYYNGCTLMFHPFYTHNPHCLPTDTLSSTLIYLQSPHCYAHLFHLHTRTSPYCYNPINTPLPHCSTNKHTLIHTSPSNIPHPCVPLPHTLHPSYFYGTLVKQSTRRNSITETLF